jgi:hypothetical protein
MYVARELVREFHHLLGCGQRCQDRAQMSRQLPRVLGHLPESAQQEVQVEDYHQEQQETAREDCRLRAIA